MTDDPVPVPPLTPEAKPTDRDRWECAAHNRAIEQALDEIRDHLRNVRAAQAAVADLVSTDDAVHALLRGAERATEALRERVLALTRRDLDDDIPF